MLLGNTLTANLTESKLLFYIYYIFIIYIYNNIYTSFLVTQVSARANRWLAGKIYHKLKLTDCKQIVFM